MSKMAYTTEQEACCLGLHTSMRRKARSLWEAALDFRNHKEIDFAFSKCDPHPFPHPDSDRLEHCYKYGKGNGKFFPVLLEQKLGDYVVNAKLGHGNFASVWQCNLQDGKKRDFCYESVAIKVCTNSKKDSKDDVTEARILQKLGKRSDGKGDFGKKHLQKVDECFRVRGHFGDHFCIVNEAIGPSLDYYFNLVEKQGLGHFDYQVSKKITFQLLAACTWLHKQGYAHGDIHPHNILMKEQNFQAGTNAKRYLDPRNTKPEDLQYMPEYLVSCIDDDMTERAPLTLENCDARLADFGQVFKKNRPRRLYKMTTPKGNRSPEWALKHTPITISIDVWAIACIAYRMTTGQHLMFVEERYKDENGKYTQKRTRADINDDHMPRMVELLGTPPKWIIEKWKLSGLPKMNWKATVPGGNLHERIMRERPADMTDAEAFLFEDFIRSILNWDYQYRATAVELVQHDWFQSILSKKDRLALKNLAPTSSSCAKAFETFKAKCNNLKTKIEARFAKKEELEAEKSYAIMATATH